jgi:hypothetical protein
MIGTAILVAGAVWSVRYAWGQWAAVPRLHYLSTIDLGEHEFNSIAVGRIAFVNSGRRAVYLNGFATSCSCAGVEQEVHGRFYRVESVIVPTHGTAEIVVRVAVGASPGDRQNIRVVFTSNDTSRPTGTIDVTVSRVRSGVFAVPRAILFGEVRIGQVGRRLIDLYDNRQTGVSIAKVRSTRPDRFEARFLPADEHDQVVDHENGGRFIGRVEVVARTATTGSLNGGVEVIMADVRRKPDQIAVMGEVCHDVECRPSTLVLPRREGNNWVYAGRIALSHRDGHPIQIEVERLPQGVVVEIERPFANCEDTYWLNVSWNRPTIFEAREERIRVSVTTGQNKTAVDIPILLAGELATIAGAVEREKQ